MHVAEQVQPVIHRDHDYILPARQVFAAIDWLTAGPKGKPSAVNPDHDWALSVVGAGRPDVQKQAVLILNLQLRRSGEDAAHLHPEIGDRSGDRSTGNLHGWGAVVRTIQDGLPGVRLLRRHPTQGTNRRSSVANALEGVNPIMDEPLDAPIGAVDHLCDCGNTRVRHGLFFSSWRLTAGLTETYTRGRSSCCCRGKAQHLAS